MRIDSDGSLKEKLNSIQASTELNYNDFKPIMDCLYSGCRHLINYSYPELYRLLSTQTEFNAVEYDDGKDGSNYYVVKNHSSELYKLVCDIKEHTELIEKYVHMLKYKYNVCDLLVMAPVYEITLSVDRTQSYNIYTVRYSDVDVKILIYNNTNEIVIKIYD